MAQLQFYAPAEWVEPLPSSVKEFLEWQQQHGYLAIGAWLVYTFLQLRSSGLPVTFCTTPPDSGIIITHSRVLRDVNLPASEKIFLICLEGDRGRCPNTHISVVQNPIQASTSRFWRRYYIPHWPQQGLVARNTERGDIFEAISYLGAEFNLVEELQDSRWEQDLEKLSLKWQPKYNYSDWTDYSDVDCVVAIRGFRSHWNDAWKPPTKLFNAWRAGVPIIVGPESAFKSSRKTKWDFIEVTSYEEILAALNELKLNRKMRRTTIEHAAIRAAEFSDKMICKAWESFLIDTAIPAYEIYLQLSHFDKVTWILTDQIAKHTDDAFRYTKWTRGRIEALVTGQKFRGYL